MINAIVDILKQKIESLSYADRVAGIVQTAKVKGSKGKLQTYPISCDVSGADCVENGRYKDLMPDDRRKSIFYFEDTSGALFQDQQRDSLRFIVRPRLVGWLNLKKFGVDDCTVTAQVISEIISKIQTTKRINSTPFTKIKVNVLRQLQRNSAIFSKYTYDEPKTQYLMYPFDFFAIDFEVEFYLNKNCVTDFPEGTPDECLREGFKDLCGSDSFENNYSPIQIWDSCHRSSNNGVWTINDFNEVGDVYDLSGRSAELSPSLISYDPDFNGYPSFDFNGAEDFIADVSNWRGSDSEGAICFVVKKKSGSMIAGLVSCNVNSDDNIVSQVGAGNVQFTFKDNLGVINLIIASFNPDDGNAHVFGIMYKDNEFKVYVDGEEVPFINISGDKWLVDAENRTNLSIGSINVLSASVYADIKWAHSSYLQPENFETFKEYQEKLTTKYIPNE